MWKRFLGNENRQRLRKCPLPPYAYQSEIQMQTVQASVTRSQKRKKFISQ